ncbi:hypothetical protein [Streptomyces tauricus]|uniref:hypothetical protein n=1 Tax=Streptomyces tauricus TaxID=68274 RepID=UPI002243C71A|nr:hypothetical protein [Streptomyces tauricus]MCW8103369.1 hypothetical protein [Streptomyces tauricus]
MTEETHPPKEYAMPQMRTAAYAAISLFTALTLSACSAGGEDNDKAAPGKSSNGGLNKLSGDRRTAVETPITTTINEGVRQSEAYVTVCEHTAYKECKNLPVHKKNADEDKIEDKISSVNNPNDFDITFYADREFSGASITVPAHSQMELDPAGFEDGFTDRISSWQPQISSLTDQKSLVTICTEAELGGDCEDLPILQYELGKYNDKITSIQNSSEVDLVFYSENNFRGAGIVVPSHTYANNLDLEGVASGLNDKISSWQPLTRKIGTCLENTPCSDKLFVS